MTKKRNYENDEAYKNFRVEDLLPEMKWREPEAKVSEAEAPTEEATLFPSLEEPDTSAVQVTMPEAVRQDEPEIREDDADNTGEEVEATVSETDVPVERIIARRISSKQRRLSLEEYRTTFLQVPKITDRKPVFLSGEMRDRLDEIVRRIGGRGLSVSGLVENLARHHLSTYENDIDQWRKL
ncbi:MULTISPECIES: DUF3408 domain-containing protein [Bacteroidaceae]|jgi:hypothetical protein|uniref:DUF3408 domain-containing protein n=1 Tax=Bacteroidaceae TaxID=815 RepID=UPI001C8CD537|nr:MULTISPECIES: DUF3408 domain-containing protein [Bacteroidaceae]MBX9091989.1 DUF3408 domain-containing protein [Bacteroides xylanisolvens]MBX9166225.1 DUF3408 domain-containing protein [Bacteroides xylanisolvens]MCE8786348.1 DUF3408 domain-containing protein [Phocaeicola dorei]